MQHAPEIRIGEHVPELLIHLSSDLPVVTPLVEGRQQENRHTKYEKKTSDFTQSLLDSLVFVYDHSNFIFNFKAKISVIIFRMIGFNV